MRLLPVVPALAWALVAAPGCLNPFAPGLDAGPAAATCNPLSLEGAFECFRSGYTVRDTAAYGRLLAQDFVFIYRDYERGVDVTWGRDEEMRATYGLFRNAQRLDLIWNNVISQAADSVSVTLIRGFNLTITFNPTDVERVDGYANLTFRRTSPAEPWRIVRWRDESNF
ncbi:MAG: hypothetical protein WB626_01775 [Bacteroidota bacterium]